jgi:hypothetical protein
MCVCASFPACPLPLFPSSLSVTLSRVCVLCSPPPAATTHCQPGGAWGGCRALRLRCGWCAARLDRSGRPTCAPPSPLLPRCCFACVPGVQGNQGMRLALAREAEDRLSADVTSRMTHDKDWMLFGAAVNSEFSKVWGSVTGLHNCGWSWEDRPAPALKLSPWLPPCVHAQRSGTPRFSPWLPVGGVCVCVRPCLLQTCKVTWTVCPMASGRGSSGALGLALARRGPPPQQTPRTRRRRTEPSGQFGGPSATWVVA